ncbi:DNA helicase-2 / ATP-dependent DNA helicase PcrA [Marinitoga hydrogenitolerans DSM 16785]|uniref:DNA 3'-5' helicase n=1 Tax=Marinitoga hydrogenitolerans (strain DSM 16785 / JCM 12826 / AT1271) TaxID=1122195 RepID=A0A1M4T4D6_MARH1|nr:ATP-dependent helicase [Marinitoga hydrogenitolerans]SHE39255.1 DNA helicase-2 / ATP-dependent DNA helicase PcrA [Marinitoga hydrogenitolerans DSM 16785]
MEEKVFNIKRNEYTIPEFFKEELDDEQLKAVINSKGRSLIIAGPGSGKTRVITYKIAYLLSQGIRPENILLVTFTRASAKEMIERVKNVTNVDTSSLTAGTFHHICNMILRRYAKVLGYDNNFSILDSEDSKDLMRIAKNEYKGNLTKEEAKQIPNEGVILKIVGYAANTLKSLREAVLDVAPYLIDVEDDIEKIYMHYIDLKQKINAMDYDDMLVNTLRLLETNDDIRNHIASKYKWVLVDEFQDTSLVQLRIVEFLSSVHKNLIVVGDDSQSIYSFRGSRFENVEDFQNHENVKLFKIQTNYRSVPEIVELENYLIPTHSIPKKLKPFRSSFNIKPKIVKTYDELEQADFVVQLIENKFNEGISPEDIAILYRSHSLSMTLQQKLDARKISYKLLSGKRFIETRHIKDIMAFLKIVANPFDNISWSRVLKLFPGIGQKTMTKITKEFYTNLMEYTTPYDAFENINLKKYPKLKDIILYLYENETENPQDLIDYIYLEFYKEYLELNFKDAYSRKLDIERLSEIASRYETLDKFLEELALSENIEIQGAEKDRKVEKITLTTVHGAKGLEWKVVIIISVNPGDFPNGMALKDKKLDEEERLFYVAVTRAKDELYIVKQLTGTTKPYYGNSFYIKQKLPDFTDKIPKRLVEYWKIGYTE